MNERHLDPPEDDPEEGDAGDYGDWLYEQWKDRELDKLLEEKDNE